MVTRELGIQISSVMALAKNLYQRFDVDNSAELGMKIRLGDRQNEAR